MNCLVVAVVVVCVAQSVFTGPVGHYPGAHGLASPVVLPSGYLADAPDVAALKAAHSVALRKAAAAAAAAPEYGYGHHGGAGTGYAGPLAVPVLLPSGYLADAPDVAALKAAHSVALSKAAAAAAAAPEHGYGGYGVSGAGYAGPLAVPVVLPSGYLADAPDVIALKAAHSVALSKAAAAAAADPEYGHGHGYYH